MKTESEIPKQLKVLADISKESSWECAFEYVHSLSNVDRSAITTLMEAIATPLGDEYILHKLFAFECLRLLEVGHQELLPYVIRIGINGSNDECKTAISWLAKNVTDDPVFQNVLQEIFTNRKQTLGLKSATLIELVGRFKSVLRALKTYREIFANRRDD